MNQGGTEALLNANRKVPSIKKPVDSEIEKTVINHAIEYTAYGQARTCNELRKQEIFVFASCVRSIWLRNSLENFKKCLKALEEKVNKAGIILSESQIVALERKKEENEIYGEIETSYPAYLGSQDMFYVGYLKGVGRVYQQTFVYLTALR